MVCYCLKQNKFVNNHALTFPGRSASRRAIKTKAVIVIPLVMPPCVIERNEEELVTSM